MNDSWISTHNILIFDLFSFFKRTNILESFFLPYNINNTKSALQDKLGMQSISKKRQIHKEDIRPPSNFRIIQYVKILDDDNYDVSVDIDSYRR